ncbi:YckD family protein [Rossellomorea aquimaris]|uniref:YckD family protein n=1 Tax=Rossellomorea aquimaris TaxID=189382 RepID=UPI001CD39127|nr:YckD family protein [Rossellomorea aquimaris]MCA1053914.1 YckD family protein [Rossellomorea aquimaris]
MKKWIFTLMSICFLSFSMLGSAYAEGEQDTPQKVNLTDTQKQELDKLHKQLFSTKKELINKYVEYGVFSKDQGDRMIKKMEERYQALKQNGYMMRWHPHKQGKLPHSEKSN